MAASEDDNFDEEFENLENKQRLKAALHYTVGKICEEIGEEASLRYSKHFIAALTETTFKQIDSFATDLELFAKHAKRTVINSDDVVLLSRRSSVLNQHMKERSQELNEAHVIERANKKSKKAKKQKTLTTTDEPLE
ncbi:centromere S-like [Paramuricea clavata]|uniref:Centromere protein S n=1 Tax=Paramuricea clavata TaxID=317549 RepID=A0A6S7GHB6_PARCT|nr:centromere S-like [Paramuricea clavata]